MILRKLEFLYPRTFTNDLPSSVVLVKPSISPYPWSIRNCLVLIVQFGDPFALGAPMAIPPTPAGLIPFVPEFAPGISGIALAIPSFTLRLVLARVSSFDTRLCVRVG